MFKKITFIIILILLSNAVIYAQDDEETSVNPDLTLFVEEEIMTLYVSHDEDISIEGFQFQINIEDGDDRYEDENDDDFVEFSPIIRFFILRTQNFVLNPGTCLVYLINRDAEDQIPEQCDINDTYIAYIDIPDRFWRDPAGNRKTIVFLRDGNVFGEPCGQRSNGCPIYFSVSEPVVSLDPQPANWERYNPVTSIERIISQSSSRDGINDIIVTSDNNYFISGHTSGDLCVWKNNKFLTDPLECFDDDVTGHRSGITTLEKDPFSDTGFLEFATGGSDGLVYRWSVDIDEDDNDAIALRLNEDSTLNLREPINDLSWNPRSEMLAIATLDRIIIWNLSDESRQPIPIEDSVAIEWRPDGEYIAAINTSGITRLANISSRNYTQVDNYGGNVSGVDIVWNHLNNDLIVLAEEDSKGSVHAYADFVPESGCRQCPNDIVSQNLDQIAQIAVSPNGELIAIAAKGAIHILDAQTPYLLLNRYTKDDANDIVFTAVTWNSNNQLIAGDDNGALHVWNVDPTIPERLSIMRDWQVSTQGAVLGLAWESNGEIISVVDESRNLSIWDSYGNLQGNALAHRDIPLAIDWHPFSNIIVTGGCGPSITIWEEDVIAQIILPGDTSNCTTAVDFDPSGEVLVSMNEAGNLTLWDWAKETSIGSRSFDAIGTDIGWSQSGDFLAFTDVNGSLQVFSTGNNILREVLVRQPVQSNSFNSLAWSPDEAFIATASSNNWIAIWDREDSNRNEDFAFEGSFRLEGHSASVASVSWSSRNNWLVSVGDDQKIIVWDVATGQRLAEMTMESTPTNVQWIPDVPGVAVGDIDGNITLYSFTYSVLSSEQ